jgi:segregation and condensation protein A
MAENVKLEIFEGPLDLLLHLIRKNEVDIYDIPVALITRQYLEYLELMEEINISLAGEFMVMATTLVQIKTRMMLPLPPADSGEENEDPRLDLLSQLKEHARMKYAVDYLEARPRLGRDWFMRAGGEQELEGLKESEEIIAVGIFELVSALQKLLGRERRQFSLNLKPADRVSLEEKMSQLLASLRQRLNLTFEQCFAGAGSRDEVVVTFMSLLELAKRGMVTLGQEYVTEEDVPGRWTVIRVQLRPMDDWYEPAPAAGAQDVYGKESGPAAERS